MRTSPATPRNNGTSTFGNVAIGSLAVFGIIVTSAVLGVVVAGMLQWRSTVPDLIDDGLPLVVIAAGMVMAGRVAADVAGRRGPYCAVGAAILTGAVGMTIERATSAHGDAIEPPQVAIAALTVLVVTGVAAAVVQRRRHR